MAMIPIWRIGLAVVCVVAIYLLTQPVLTALLLAVRRRIGKRFRWVADIHRYLLVYLSWISMLVLFVVVAVYVLELRRASNVVQMMSYMIAVPVVLATFALRVVVTNMVVRHFKWDRASLENDAKIFVVTETMKFLCFILIMVEIFWIFFRSNDIAGFLFIEVFLAIEIVLILSGFTLLKNVATGLFLVWAEPFRTGSFCRILHLKGFVDKVSLARTILRRQDGSLVYIPNGVFADFHQTNGNPSGAFQHDLTVHLHPTTSIEVINRVREELSDALSGYCHDLVDQMPRSQRSSILSDSFNEPRQSGFRQSSSSVVDAHVPIKALHIGLPDMSRLRIRMGIDRSLYSSLEAAKTEINMCILQVFARHDVTPLARG